MTTNLKIVKNDQVLRKNNSESDLRRIKMLASFYNHWIGSKKKFPIKISASDGLTEDFPQTFIQDIILLSHTFFHRKRGDSPTPLCEASIPLTLPRQTQPRKHRKAACLTRKHTGKILQKH